MRMLRRLLPLLLLMTLIGSPPIAAQDAGTTDGGTTDGGTGDGGSATPSIKLPDPLQPCQCLDCLKLFRLSSLAERKIYEDRLPLARKELQGQIDRYNNDAGYREKFDAAGRNLFCELWSTAEDELGVVRDYLIPKSQETLFAKDKRCLPLTGGGTDPSNCKIDPLRLLVNESTAPCQQIHLAILAHELVHVQDCKRNEQRPTWTDTPGSSCKDAFADRAAPSPAELMAFVEASFATELRAHQLEAQVESLLINELTKQCKPDDYSSRMARNYKEAAEFLKAARKYEISFE